MIFSFHRETPWLKRSTLLFRALRSAVESREHAAPLPYERLAEITSAPKSTLCRWLHGESEVSLEAVLRLFERLPPTVRMEVLNRVCRICPRLEPPDVDDPVTIGHLVTLLQKPGLTIAQGDETALVIFLTAVANTFYERGRKIIGFDTHNPSWFSPAPGVIYSSGAFDSVLACARNADGAIITLNLGTLIPQPTGFIRDWSLRNRVLVAVPSAEERTVWAKGCDGAITVGRVNRALRIRIEDAPKIHRLIQ